MLTELRARRLIASNSSAAEYILYFDMHQAAPLEPSKTMEEACVVDLSTLQLSYRTRGGNGKFFEAERIYNLIVYLHR